MLGSLLRDVSRSFYLTLRVLPAAVRPQISLAYLLARTTDTIADTELLPLEQRFAALANLRSHIVGAANGPLGLGDFSRHQGSVAERVLLEHCDSALKLLRELGAQDQALVVGVLQTIVGGQELDLHRFGAGSPHNVLALKTAAELDDYTYRVAGCVGEFWTRICRAHVFASARIDDAVLLSNGIRFGKGLQLVNILRDLPADLRIGRCYLPLDELKQQGLSPADLLEMSAESRVRPIYNNWLEVAQGHLDAGWRYVNQLPPRCVRVRLACVWPLVLGVRTLQLLRTGSFLDATRRIKVPRPEVRAMLLRSLLYYPFRGGLNRLYQQSCRQH
jgi:farnesyl-diphosphate farnesyltransferase